MAVLTVYNKTIATDFPNAKVNVSSLKDEIDDSSIVIGLSHINIGGGICSIWFKDVLTAGYQATLSSIVSIHDGTADEPEASLVRVTEENVATGGHFASKSVQVTAAANSEETFTFYWPYNVTAMVMKFTTTETQVNDTIDLFMSKDTVVGALTASSALAPVWTSQNYTSGQSVTFVHPLFGSRIYTCYVDTISNEPPTDASYWTFGFQLNVSPTVIEHSEIGFHLKITDGVNSDDLGAIIYKDSNTVYTEFAPTNTYSAASPTYVMMTVYVLKDHQAGHPTNHTVGDSKIGGTHVPANTIVYVTYKNNHNATQTLSGSVDHLY